MCDSKDDNTDCPLVFGHDFVETRKLSVRYAAALFETFDDIVLNAAEQ